MGSGENLERRVKLESIASDREIRLERGEECEARSVFYWLEIRLAWLHVKIFTFEDCANHLLHLGSTGNQEKNLQAIGTLITMGGRASPHTCARNFPRPERRASSAT
jgi:hypothetical protein